MVHQSVQDGIKMLVYNGSEITWTKQMNGWLFFPMIKRNLVKDNKIFKQVSVVIDLI